MGNQRQAQAVFETLCKALDERHWKYEKHQAVLVITFDYRGEDFPMSCVMAIDAEREVVQLFPAHPTSRHPSRLSPFISMEFHGIKLPEPQNEAGSAYFSELSRLWRPEKTKTPSNPPDRRRRRPDTPHEGSGGWPR